MRYVVIYFQKTPEGYQYPICEFYAERDQAYDRIDNLYSASDIDATCYVMDNKF